MKNVLWIEDNEELIARYKGIFDGNGVKLFVARTLRSADNKVNKVLGIENIDLIISDLNMPECSFDDNYKQFADELFSKYGMDLFGLVWLKRFIDENPDYPQEKIAVLSGFLDEGMDDEIKAFAPRVTVIDKLSLSLMDEINDFITK